MIDLRPYNWHTNNTQCFEWFERDRACVRLTDMRDNEIICIWDDDVAQFVCDGFKMRKTWHEAMCEFANEMKLRVKVGKREN